jgi:hypothetical protein
MMRVKVLASFSVALLLVGCGSSNSSITSFISKESQLQTRQYQIKPYKTDKETLMKVAISTLQDDNYIIHHSDTNLGVITASKKEDKDISKVSMNIQEINKSNSKLRLNIEMSSENFLGSTKTQDINKVYYYYIFDRISKSLFLEETLSPKNEKQKAGIVIKKETTILDNSIRSVVPKTMVVTKPVNRATMPQHMQTNQYQYPTVTKTQKVETRVHQAPQQPQNSGYTNQQQQVPNEPTAQKRVVTRGNSNMILRQDTNVVQQAPVQNYQVAPNPDGAVQYYYNSETNQYEYYGY